jgi:hypothetical protein
MNLRRAGLTHYKMSNLLVKGLHQKWSLVDSDSQPHCRKSASTDAFSFPCDLKHNLAARKSQMLKLRRQSYCDAG